MKKFYFLIAVATVTLLSGCNLETVKEMKHDSKAVLTKPTDINKEYYSAMGETCLITNSQELFCHSDKGWIKRDLLIKGKQ